jgi:circadian clock protein KaiC
MSGNTFQPVPLHRISSGISGLDTILNGGFLKGGIYLLMGPPGAGKTILGNQFSFSHVANGGRVIYVTLLAESHARMFTHIQTLSFFDPTPIADTLYYVSGYSTLEQEGLKGLTTFLRKEVRNHHATALIIDGLTTAREVEPSSLDLKHFLHELHVFTETIGCTTLLLTQFDDGNQVRPEFIMVDGLIELNDRLVDMRSIRELEVHKFRGSKSLSGRHVFEINDDGILVHPRTEALLAQAIKESVLPTISEQRARFGVPRLDEMLNGGVPPGSTTILFGAPGAGKTLLGLHFLYEGAQRGEPGLLFGFNEVPFQLEQKARRLGLDFRPFVEGGLIKLFWQSQIEDILDVFAERLLEEIERFKVKRLFIDSLQGFQHVVASKERLSLFMSALVMLLRLRGVTTLCTMEVGELISESVHIPINAITALADNIISLRYVELRSQLYRLLSIMKMRDSSYNPSIREFRITPSGIELATTFQSAEAILTGEIHPAALHQSQFDDEPHVSQEQQL